MNQTYGYVRVSSKDQNIDRQIEALKSIGVDEQYIYIDKSSGKDFARSEYMKLKNILSQHDTLIVKSIDRLGRNYGEILSEWREISNEMKVYIKVIDIPLLDTTKTFEDLTGTFISDLVLQILSYVAEQERIMIKQRQAEGIAVAKSKGVKFGRPRVKRPAKFDSVYEQWAKKELTTKEAMKILKLKETSFLKFAREQKETNQKNKK